MSNISPTSGGAHIPPKTNNIEGVKGQGAGQDPQNAYQADVQQIMVNLSKGDRDDALDEIYALMKSIQESGGAPSIVNGILNKLMVASSEIKAGVAPPLIMPNLNDAYAQLAYL